MSEEDIDKAGELRSEAMSKASEGDLEGAVATFTEAIQLNPGSALLYAKRASLYIKLSRPNAAIRDTTEVRDLFVCLRLLLCRKYHNCTLSFPF